MSDSSAGTTRASAVQQIEAARACLAATQPVRREAAPLAQNGQRHRAAESDVHHTRSKADTGAPKLAGHTVTAIEPAAAASTRSQGEALQDHGIAALEDLRMVCMWNAQRSQASGSVMRVLVMCVCTPDRPCQLGPAPAPPHTVS